MAVTLYDATVACFIQSVAAMEGVLARGFDHCRDNNIDPATIVSARLTHDMFPFGVQVHFVAMHSIGAIEGVRAGVFTPGPGPDADYAGLQKRAADTLASLKALSPSEVNGFEGKDVMFKFGERTMPFTAENFLLSFSIPNFYFHATTVYDILRMKGAPIGKRDFMGQVQIKAS